jgi:hypothetical protein
MLVISGLIGQVDRICFDCVPTIPSQNLGRAKPRAWTNFVKGGCIWNVTMPKFVLMHMICGPYMTIFFTLKYIQYKS